MAKAGELAQLRRKAGRSVPMIARTVDLSEQRYRAIERGERPLESFRVEPLAGILGVNADVIRNAVEVRTADNFGERVASLRQRRNMSQNDLAAAMNVSKQQVSRWETGKASPPLARIIDLARVLQCTTSDLMEGNSESVSSQMGHALAEKFEEIVPEEQTKAFALVMGILTGFATIPAGPSKDDKP